MFENLTNKFEEIFSSLKKSPSLDEKQVDEGLRNIRQALLEADVSLSVAKEFVNNVKPKALGQEIIRSTSPGQMVVKIVHDELVHLLGESNSEINLNAVPPVPIMLVGLQGSGKTTSIAKLTRRFTESGLRVVLGAGDTFRAAAVEQLSMWAGRLGAEIVRGDPGSDPASIAHRAVAQAVEGSFDICIIDTAGRLQNQSNLMQELGKIRRVISKQIPDAPHEVLLVIDATAGQNALSQAEGFKEAAGCTGIVLAKLDGSARGGVIVPVAQRFGLPVKFVGLGESADDLATFDPEAFVDAMLEGVLKP